MVAASTLASVGRIDLVYDISVNGLIVKGFVICLKKKGGKYPPFFFYYYFLKPIISKDSFSILRSYQTDKV